TCTLDRPERYRTFSDDDQLIMSGALADGEGGEGMRYMTRLKAIAKNGKVHYQDSQLVVDGADEVTLILSASTDYVLDYPTYKGRDYQAVTLERLEKACKKSFSELRESHTKEYGHYFDRVSLDLTSHNVVDTISTDERIQRFKSTRSDPYLEELM